MTPQDKFKGLVDAMLVEGEAIDGSDEFKSARRMFGSTSIKGGQDVRVPAQEGMARRQAAGGASNGRRRKAVINVTNGG